MRRHVSHHDRCRLEAIERRLESVDPRLAERFSRWPPAPASRWATWSAMLVVLLGSLGMLVGSCCWDAGDLVGSLIPLLLGALGWRNSRPYGQLAGRSSCCTGALSAADGALSVGDTGCSRDVHVRFVTQASLA
jgi:hypothetical protein